MLTYDPKEAIAAICEADPQMAAAIEDLGPFRLERSKARSPFHALTRAIVYQQLSGKAAATIYSRILALFPNAKQLTPKRILSVSQETLRSAGASRAKARALQDLAQKVLDGTVPPHKKDLQAMQDDEIIKRITQVWGVGQWTVEMMLIFYLGRPDILPTRDLGILKGFQNVYQLDQKPSIDTLLAQGEQWRPFRSVASWYLWRAAS